MINIPHADSVLRGFVGKEPKIVEKTGTAFINLAQTIDNVTTWTTIQVSPNLVTDEIRNLKAGDEIKAYGRFIPRPNQFTRKNGELVNEEVVIFACYHERENEVSTTGDGILLVSTRASRAEKRKVDEVQPLRLRETA